MAKDYGNARQYCWDNFLANNTLQVLGGKEREGVGGGGVEDLGGRVQ